MTFYYLIKMSTIKLSNIKIYPEESEDNSMDKSICDKV